MTSPESEKRYPRPSQVTVAGWSLLVAGAMLVPSIFDATSRLRSVETRESLEAALTTGSARGLGLDLEQATELIRVLLLVGGAAAAAVAILGWFVLQGDGKARIAATVAVVPVLACAPFAGGFLPALVAAGVAMLWTGPARDWFAGREPRQPRLPPRSGPGAPGGSAGGSAEPPRPHEHAGSRPEERAADPAVRVTSPVTSAPPVHGYGAPQHQPWPPYQQQPWPSAPSGPVRPAQVQTACLLTWVFAGITAGFGLLLLLSMAADPARMTDLVQDAVEQRDQAIDQAVLRPVLWTLGALLVLWSSGAALLAHQVWRGQAWARIALIVSTALAGLVSVLAFPLSLLHLAATAWVVGLLLSPPTRAWFRAD